MIVFNKKKYRFIDFQEDVFLVDINSFWWSSLCGLGVWYMPMKAIKVNKLDICQVKQLNVLNIVLGLSSLVLLIVLYSIGNVFEITLSVAFKVLLEIISFIFLIGIKKILNLYEQQRMIRQVEEQNIVIQINVKSKRIIIKSIILNVFLQVLIPLCTILIFIFSDSASEMFLICLLGNWIFLSVGEWTNKPYTSNEIKTICERGQKC